MDTQESNKLIAEFMDLIVEPTEKSFTAYYPPFQMEEIYCSASELRYATSWDWLMLVVGKIENLDRLAGIVTINQNICGIKSNMLGDRTVMAFESGNYEEENTKLSNTYKAVVIFITWYNKNK